MKLSRFFLICFCLHSIFYFISFSHSDYLDTKHPNIARAGDFFQYFNSGYCLYLAKYNQDDQGVKSYFKSFLLNTVVTHSLKRSLNNVYVQGDRLGQRPYGGNLDFPSGHTSHAFNAAWYVKKRYGFKQSIPLLFTASFVGFSRVYTNHHTMAGMGFGILTGIITAEISTRVFDSSADSVISINSDGRSHAIIYRFLL